MCKHARMPAGEDGGTVGGSVVGVGRAGRTDADIRSFIEDFSRYADSCLFASDSCAVAH